MADPKPVLQRPPGYRDLSSATPPPAAPVRPPPRAAVPPTFQPVGKPPRRHRRRSCCCRFCCCLTISLLVLLLLIAAFTTAVYFIFYPKLPAFRLQSLKASDFHVTDKGDGTAGIDSTAALAVQASNPNPKLELSYGVTEAAVTIVDDEDGDVAVGTGRVPGFAQGTRNDTVLKFNATVKGVLVDSASGNRIRTQFKSKGIRFRVLIRTRIGVRVLGLMTGKLTVRFSCGPVSLSQAESGGAKCGIDMFSWIIAH